MLASAEPDGPAFLSITGAVREGMLRVTGEYIEPEEIIPYIDGEESESLASVSRHIINSLLCAGVRSGRWRDLVTHGRHSKMPEDYQLLPMDLLESAWLDMLLPDKFPRTRLLIADEGGLGKTLAASLAIANTFYDYGGVILVLCPPLLKEKWATEIRLCMRARSREVRTIYASQLNSDMAEGVYVVSKHSVAFRFQENPTNLAWIPESEMVVIDEVHQGTLSPVKNWQGGGVGGLTRDGVLFKSQRKVCCKSKRAIGLSASPFHHGIKDMLTVFEMIGGEAGSSVTDLDSKLFTSGWQTRFEEWNNRLNQAVDIVGGSLDDARQWIDDSIDDLGQLLDWMQPNEKDEIIQTLQAKGAGLLSENTDGQGHRMLRELHPFGRFFSIVRRSDLGPKAEDLFRKRIDEFHKIELDNDHSKLIKLAEENSENKFAAKKIIGSWAENVNDPERYSFISIPSGPTLPSSDPRWEFVIEQVKNELSIFDQQGIEESRGVVIFVEYIGTLRRMEEDIKSKIDHDKIEVVGIYGELDREEKVRRIKKGHTICRRGKLPIFICTSSAEVGVDMEWATLGIMWDINSNPESLSQRAWRLDRRNDMGGVTKDFRIIHIQNDFNKKLIEGMNKSHSESSAILGRNQNGSFIPDCTSSSQKIERIWPSKRGVFSLSSEEAKKIQARFNPNVQSKDLERDLDILFWIWVSEMNYLNIDLDDLSVEGFLSLDDSAFKEDKPSMGVNDTQMKIIWDLASISSITEMASLWKISATPIDVCGGSTEKHRLGLRFSSPGSPHLHGSCPINREGQLSSRLRRLLLRCSKEAELLEFGTDSEYLGWVLDGHSLAEGASIVVELGWLELWVDHRECMETLDVPSPLMVCHKGEIEFLENSRSWKNVIEDAIESSLYANEAVKYYGIAPSANRDWPVLNSNNLLQMEQKISTLKGDLLDNILGIRKTQRIRPQGISNLYRSLKLFEFSEENAVPVIYFQEDD